MPEIGSFVNVNDHINKMAVDLGTRETELKAKMTKAANSKDFGDLIAASMEMDNLSRQMEMTTRLGRTISESTKSATR